MSYTADQFGGIIQGDRRESDGFQKTKYSVDFQLEVDVFLQN